MATDYKITKEDIWTATDGGRRVIVDIYPQSDVCFSSGGRRNFKIREDDRNPSCAVFRSSKDGVWMIQDKGGSDTKAKTAIQLVQEMQRLSFGEALQYIAQHYAPHLIDGQQAFIKPKPDVRETAPQSEYSLQLRSSGKFTKDELDLLGWNITQEMCDSFGLKPLDSYTTPRNSSGKSYRVAATDKYPMYFYDYGTAGKGKDDGHPWGKIYQPLGDLRFLYYGSKPSEFIFGDMEFITHYQKARNDSEYQMTRKIVSEEGEVDYEPFQWDHLIICSGPSDALNVRNASGEKFDYHVCWLNSETAELTEWDFSIFRRLAKNIYILFDIDDTGIAHMYDIALRYLEIKIIRLPEELKRFKDRKGKPCKDAKDFFVHFRRPENQNPRNLFNELVKLSGSLQFWSEKWLKDKNGGMTKIYDINNVQQYAFLEASGYHRISSDVHRKGYTFCKVQDNVVTRIDDEAIASHCTGYLLEYLRTHSKYYNQNLINTIYRSNQTKQGSLENLPIISPNLRSWDESNDHFFFRNGIFRVNASGVKAVKPTDCPCMVYSDKIIPFDFTPLAKDGKMPFFDIEPTAEFKELDSRLKATKPRTPEWFFLKKEVDAMKEERRYSLKIMDADFTFLQYVYNTGRTYWRKEELNLPLNEDEKLEQDLNFISKVMALGYLLAKHKSAGQPYAVFCMEQEQSEEGTHLGGTGKSLFAKSVEALRKQLFIDGQNLNQQKGDFLLQGVERGVTDCIFIDDLSRNVDLHKFMPMITGKMVVNPKYVAAFTIDFKDSPKVVFTSNHAIRDFDASLNRRTWFTAFSDYYHAYNEQKGLTERSPYTEYGYNLIDDYSQEDMNKFYNFLFNCLCVWQKIHVRIQPNMSAINKRMLQLALTDEFIYWAEDYFNESRLNTLVNKDEAFESYKMQLNEKVAKTIKAQTFKRKVIQYCSYRGWKFNPEHLLTTVTERNRNDIRQTVNGKECYFFFIDTVGCDEDTDIQENSDGIDFPDDDKPIFG